MTVKTNGAEFKRFYTDGGFWPDGAWWDDGVILVDGDESDIDYALMPDTAAVVISEGSVYDKDGRDISGFEAYFRKWKKAQSYVDIIVTVPRGKEDEVIAFAKGLKP